jgi:hypothetical protein
MTASVCRSTPSGWSVAASSGRRRLTGLSRSVRRNWPICSTTYRDAPGADADLAGPEEVEVTEPRHPLYRRRFRLLSVVQGARSAGFVSVEYRLDISLILPISATSLQAVVTDKTPTKLSLEALGDLLTVAGGHEGGCRSSPAMSGEACRQPCAGRSRRISPSSSGR